MRAMCLAAVAALLVWSVRADEGTLIREKVSVTNGAAKPMSASVRFTAPAAKEGERLCLSFDAHFEMPVHGGWSRNGFRLSVNGKALGKFTADGRLRVQNRAATVRTSTSSAR